MHPPLSTELALRAFEADAALSTALAEFQAQPAAETILAEARRATAYGFSWFARPSESGFVQVALRHRAGAEISADGESITALLAGLLGHLLAQDIAVFAADQAAEPEQGKPQEASTPAEARPAPSPAQAAAESLATATGGAVALGPTEYVPDPEAVLLTDEQKALCVAMIKVLTPEQRKNFTIAFRDAFRVPREEKAVAPLITEVRHMEFCDRWSITAGGGVAA